MTESQQQIEERIAAFVHERFLPRSGLAELPPDGSLLDRGLLDSVGVVELTAFVENAFGISVSDEDVVPEVFGTIQALATFVRTKRGA